MNLFKYFKQCMTFGEQHDESDDEQTNTTFDYPVIRAYGHGWDPTEDDSELEYPSYKKVSSNYTDMCCISALKHRGPYIECEGDDVSENVEWLAWDKIPNMIISIFDFKDEPPNSYKFGLYELLQDGSEINFNEWWLSERGQSGVFTLKELVYELNMYYPNGYYLELHMGRTPLFEFNNTDLPYHIKYSDMTNDVLYEYSLDHPSFDYLPKINYYQEHVFDDYVKPDNQL